MVKRIDDLEKKVDSYTVKQAIFIGLVIALSVAIFKPTIEKIAEFFQPNPLTTTSSPVSGKWASPLSNEPVPEKPTPSLPPADTSGLAK